MASYAWPLAPSSLDTPAVVDAGDRISSWLYMLLSTTRGERVMRAEYGLSVYDLVFENLTPGLLATVRRDLVNTIRINEPAIELKNVEVVSQDTALIISVDYVWGAEVKNVTVGVARTP